MKNADASVRKHYRNGQKVGKEFNESGEKYMLQTERLILRRWTKADTDSLYEYAICREH